MEHKINYPGITVLLLSISILLMSVGFAVRSERLTINGSTTIGENAKWDIHFANVKVNPESVKGALVEKEATIENNDSTIVNFDVTLAGYRDFYEFTVDMVNAGNINAEISNIMFISDKDALKYLDIKAVYLDGNEVKVNDDLRKNSSKTIKVRIENIYQEDLLEKKVFDISFAIEYVQKNE